MQLLLCGVTDIDVDEWEASCVYTGGFTTATAVVRWFWAEVRAMLREERAALLHFCTGSTRAPALGFASLMGYSGQPHRFTIACASHGNLEQLPMASTCFNTLKLPEYTSLPQLRQKLTQAVANNSGFDEAAH